MSEENDFEGEIEYLNIHVNRYVFPLCMCDWS